jgi:probable rRNA maturation factor
MITIQKSNINLPEVNKDLIKHAVKETMDYYNITKTDITIRLTDDNEISQLNKEYRGFSSATDVLSFLQDFTDPETGRKYLGDIVISIETAIRQAPKFELTIDQECAFLAIHGTLHLLGFDHGTPEEKKTMWEIQDKIFSKTVRDYQKEG